MAVLDQQVNGLCCCLMRSNDSETKEDEVDKKERLFLAEIITKVVPVTLGVIEAYYSLEIVQENSYYRSENNNRNTIWEGNRT